MVSKYHRVHKAGVRRRCTGAPTQVTRNREEAASVFFVERHAPLDAKKSGQFSFAFGDWAGGEQASRRDWRGEVKRKSLRSAGEMEL